jgi:hypothetical protein
MAIGFDSMLAIALLFVWVTMVACLAWQYHAQTRVNRLLRMLEASHRSSEQLRESIEQCNERLNMLEAEPFSSDAPRAVPFDLILQRLKQMSQDETQAMAADTVRRLRR